MNTDDLRWVCAGIAVGVLCLGELPAREIPTVMSPPYLFHISNRSGDCGGCTGSLMEMPNDVLFAPKYEKVCRRRLFDLPMPSGWKRDYNKMRAGTFDFLCSRWQDGVANAEPNAKSFKLRFRGLMLQQLEIGRELMMEGQLSGLLFHPTSLVNRKLSSIELARQWIAKNGACCLR